MVAGPFQFLTNHGLVLLCLAEDPRIRVRDVADRIGITERAAQRILADLIEADYVSRIREGRRNTYSVRLDLPIALPTERVVALNALFSVLLPSDPGEPGSAEPAPDVNLA